MEHIDKQAQIGLTANRLPPRGTTTYKPPPGDQRP